MVATTRDFFERFCLGLLAAVVLFGIVGALVWPPIIPRNSPSVAAIADEPAPAIREAAAIPAAPWNDESFTIRTLPYDLEAVTAGVPVPRVRLWDAPQQDAFADPRTRYDDFVRRLLPFALLDNEAVLVERARLWSLRPARDIRAQLSAEDRLWLAVVADRYGAPKDDLAELSRRIDAVPPSILLAAAARATGWGTAVSGRANESMRGNGATAGATVVAPIGRAPRASAAVASPVDAVRSAMQILNTHPAYDDFRRERERLRIAGVPLDASRLVAVLPRAGAGGMPGADAIGGVIAGERLFRFDAARLQPRRPV